MLGVGQHPDVTQHLLPDFDSGGCQHFVGLLAHHSGGPAGPLQP